MEACDNGNIEIVQLMLKHGANVHLETEVYYYLILGVCMYVIGSEKDHIGSYNYSSCLKRSHGFIFNTRP